MIGLFDSGHGGLTVFRSLVARFPHVRFVYLGDHANAPYGNRSSKEIVDFTRAGVELLFAKGCPLVILACNTATAVACRTLQQDWLPGARREGENILGVVAPMVEAATQTPWAATAPQYPQKFNADTIAIFGTERTVSSGVYGEEISKRCPKVTVLQQACADLAGAIEAGRPEAELDAMVKAYVDELLERSDGTAPHSAILGCTHYPLVEQLFVRHLPASTRLLCQPEVVADSLEDYLARHIRFTTAKEPGEPPLLLTTGDPRTVTKTLQVFMPGAHEFQPAS
ncbi:MAG: aspartate/glutamate racemase family protein [Hyphomicrobiales bacterium]|nr:aspartate/glutamate racemase family protein [Hyphomicrobiales bacterium]